MKTVLAAGVFDLLHYGHIRYLEESKKAGGPDAKLIVIVARDETVRKLKGGDPIIPEDQRRAVIEALKVVDEALLGYEEMDLVRVIQQIQRFHNYLNHLILNTITNMDIFILRMLFTHLLST